MVHVNDDKCIGCGECVDICPNGALEMKDGLSTWAHPDLCEECGLCETVCPQEAITMNGEHNGAARREG